jgi:hypothetical protein
MQTCKQLPPIKKHGREMRMQPIQLKKIPPKNYDETEKNYNKTITTR